MRNSPTGAKRTRALSLLALGSVVLLAGCSVDEAILDDNYKPVMVSERHPITVKKVTAKSGIVAPSGHLKPDQANGVIAFARDAKTMSLSAITIRYPSGSANSRAAAAEMADLIADQGIPENMIRVGSYPGGSSQPIQMSFTRKIAVTEECGAWPENLSENDGNRPWSNFGCAYQQNIAAMVANPEDFERPRSSGPILAENRTMVMKIYVENKTAGDYFTLDAVSK